MQHPKNKEKNKINKNQNNNISKKKCFMRKKIKKTRNPSLKQFFF
ncbi:hypothetical protein FSS13T_02640 [Flavobacterium saliperosum S13]|uniref:Uncharacterized protein n=1 Tax=Flavobacterium saliperosum S13 TaxID=1341155 RepID=A0ABN0QJ23_9FLAO|nr:hypothetical protein FSS13T_02640 [Flavobacterium saliperosum S13]